MAGRSEGLRAAVADALGGGEPAVAAVSLHRTIVTSDQGYKVCVPISVVAKLFWPVLPPGASDLRGSEPVAVLRADEVRIPPPLPHNPTSERASERE